VKTSAQHFGLAVGP